MLKGHHGTKAVEFGLTAAFVLLAVLTAMLSVALA